MKVGLINFNRRGVSEPGVPPVPPIGLEYLNDDIEASNHESSLLDLCFVTLADRKDSVEEFVKDKDLIGITLRNFGVDNYWMVDDQFFVPELKKVVEIVKGCKKIPVVLGGQGFSIYPEKTLDYVGADFGVSGPGEVAFCKLLNNLSSYPRKTVLKDTANINILHKRKLIDYDKYISQGGSPAIQTKSGCPFKCGFCIEARKPQYLRSLDRVFEELGILLSRGVKFLFVAEAEFNNHLRHAIAFCDGILERQLEFAWSTYLNPIPMTEELVRKMKLAGCVNPCVSVESGSDEVLEEMNTGFTVNHIRQMAEWFHKYDLPFTVDLIFGSPQDTLKSAQATIRLMEEISPLIVGMNLGLRMYANTGFGQRFLAGHIKREGVLYGYTENNDDLYKPIFYISDLRIGDFLKEVCDSRPEYRLLGYSGFGGVNYKIINEGTKSVVEAKEVGA
jgi:radical SAM superfamily enzyme YgiQ (UPF0313 family)